MWVLRKFLSHPFSGSKSSQADVWYKSIEEAHSAHPPVMLQTEITCHDGITRDVLFTIEVLQMQNSIHAWRELSHT